MTVFRLGRCDPLADFHSAQAEVARRMRRRRYELEMHRGDELERLSQPDEPWAAGTRWRRSQRAALEGDPPALGSIPLLARARRVPLPARRPCLQAVPVKRPYPSWRSTRARAGVSDAGRYVFGAVCAFGLVVLGVFVRAAYVELGALWATVGLLLAVAASVLVVACLIAAEEC